MKIQPITLDRELMSCPVCSQRIVAKVRALPVVGEGHVTEENRVELSVSTQLLAFDVSHSCPGPAEEPEVAS